jgi:hypothetical protein
MFVGQDFDDEDYEGEYYKSIKNDDYHQEPAEGEGSHTWRNQLSRLERAVISRSICFHTNLFPAFGSLRKITVIARRGATMRSWIVVSISWMCRLGSLNRARLSCWE